MTTQNYNEYYWQLTLAHSDFTGPLFNGYLGKIIAYIDTHHYDIAVNLSDAYDKLQAILIADYGIDDVSVRKAINQFVKLGFVNTGLSGYHPDAKAFLKEEDAEKKMTLFSKIVYSNSSFGRSVVKTSDDKEINFFINTLSNNGGTLTREQAVALMTIDISKTSATYADQTMIDAAVTRVRETDFEARKYNQLRYFWGLIGKLDDLRISNGRVYFASDSRLQDIESDVRLPSKGRDSYLQRLYKNLLIEESIKFYSSAICMVEKIDYPGLIASHIKPYIQSNEAEAFDGNNGLLLSRNIDILFDQGYISFDDTGKMLISNSKGLSEELKERIGSYTLDSFILNDERKSYMKYHREFVFVA